MQANQKFSLLPLAGLSLDMARHLPPLPALRAFEAAARHLSFARAAGELSVTPGAVSHHMKQLEEWVGGPLFERRANGVGLTETGRVFATRLGAIFDQLTAVGAAARVPRRAQHRHPSLPVFTRNEVACTPHWQVSQGPSRHLRGCHGSAAPMERQGAGSGSCNLSWPWNDSGRPTGYADQWQPGCRRFARLGGHPPACVDTC